jgi:hypothetical protein
MACSHGSRLLMTERRSTIFSTATRGTSQIVYIISGSLRYGQRVVSVGMGFSNPGRKHSWQAGPDGALLLEIPHWAPALMA